MTHLKADSFEHLYAEKEADLEQHTLELPAEDVDNLIQITSSRYNVSLVQANKFFPGLD
jgi:hypothetical protein